MNTINQLAERMQDRIESLKAEVDRLTAELDAGEAARRTCAVEAGIQDPSDSPCCLRDFVDTILDLRAELAAERARPRPRVEWRKDGNRHDLIVSVLGSGMLGYWFQTATGIWACWTASKSETGHAAEDAIIAALVAAAEDAGFDVSGCKEKP